MTDSDSLPTRPETHWFVGASFGGTDDQTERFIKEGIWENGYDDKFVDLVRSMRTGEPIAIKATYTRKHRLPFNPSGHSVATMAIKATGTITENLNDGKRVRVKWNVVDPPREWYFYTYLKTVWRVVPGDWAANGLIEFTFDGESQDIDRFRNHPYWKERFGDDKVEHRFKWTEFYEAISKALLPYQHDRRSLIQGVHDVASRNGLTYLHDRLPDGTSQPLGDICPFTTMGIFNRWNSNENRKKIAKDLARFLDVAVPVPDSFEGIPFLNNQRSWFFAYSDKRGAGDIDALWRVFVAAHAYVESEKPESESELIAAYDEAIEVWGVSWNLSTGLYWAHPWEFPTLDSKSRDYIMRQLRIEIETPVQKAPYNGETYLRLTGDLKLRFSEETYQVHSFPDLSLQSWHYKGSPGQSVAGNGASDDDDISEVGHEAPPIDPYTTRNMVEEGCFMPQADIELILKRWQLKKNLIIQGAPGTGKTWLATRLAFALMGERDESKVRAVQFHPNLSYEDFVRGWRPKANGKLAVVDGIFMESVRAAARSPSSRFVIVIEEINRGNPAQIFGELLTLLEAGKRTPRDAIEITYPEPDGQRRPVHIPENLYTIGTMNIADRSLALVDLALRRRFAFITLEPRLDDLWKEWVVRERNVDAHLVL
jgi:5-methylcytosine-specific restriction protein B